MKINDLLKQNLFFSNWSDSCVSQIAHNAIKTKYNAKQVIYNESDISTDLYFIISGRVRAYKVSTDGTELNYSVYKQGDIFGEISFLDGEIREASAESITPLEVVKISRRSFLKILDQLTFENFFVINKFIIKCLRQTREHVISPQGNSYTLKLKLLELLEESEDRPLVHITHTELAFQAGMSRTSLSKILSIWEQSGSIVKQKGSILLNEERFRAEKCI